MLFLVRHGESTGNRDACLQGAKIGGTLSTLGERQSLATANYLFETFEELRSGNVRIVSSPSSRAVETATFIADRLKSEIQTDEGLEELDFGDWSGMPVKDLANDPAYERWKADPWLNAPPQGETLAQVRNRMWRATLRLAIIAAAEKRPVIIVTHFFPLMTLFEHLVPGNPVRCDNASISRFELGAEGWKPTHINQIGHLSQAAPVPVRYV